MRKKRISTAEVRMKKISEQTKFLISSVEKLKLVQ